MPSVMVVDDEPAVRRVMEVGISRAGYDVLTAENGEVALAMIRERTPDVLITDIEMPRMDGRALCKSVESEFPDREFTIYVLTSLAEREHREWSVNMRDVHFLEKPVSMRMLIGRIQANLAQ